MVRTLRRLSGWFFHVPAPKLISAWRRAISMLPLTIKRSSLRRMQRKAIRQGILTPYSSNDVCPDPKEAESEKVRILSRLRNKALIYTIALHEQTLTG